MKKIVERTDIAKKLIELREERGLNATEAASLIGINHNNYRKYETKVTPKSDVLLKIAEFYGVSVDYIICGEDNTNGSDSVKEANSTPEMKSHYIVRNHESEYRVVEKNIDELSELEVMVINKLRTISSEDRADVAKYLNSKT
ncbi:MAG: helix-turn-helix transcriptional regulator, partial [Eubacterium sp.]|nr:helix-turn-helix transcriptional regulator [Eubacterium sp.]